MIEENDILDVGCSYGEFSRVVAEKGIMYMELTVLIHLLLLQKNSRSLKATQKFLTNSKL